MAHKHLNIKKQEMDHHHHEHTKGKQVGVSAALLGALAGGVLLIVSGVAPYFYGEENEAAELCAMIGAVLLGFPVVYHALKCMLHGHMHMDELVALAIVAAFATEQYATAGTVAFISYFSAFFSNDQNIV